MASARIEPTNLKVLSTVHENFTYQIENLYNIWNGDHPDVLTGYNETTALVQSFLAKALQKHKAVRMLGSNWSWTTVGYTKDWMLSTTRLNRVKRTLPEEIAENAELFEKDKFVFAQCGCSVLELNQILQSLGRSIKTTGASNGQTIAGLISNGTHGAAIDFGSTQDFVVGLHLILGPQKHVYLERSSSPIVTDLFIEKIGAERVQDDALFEAALVSFGSFGFIHGVMIETEPLFLYNVFRRQIPMTQIHPLIDNLDFTKADFLPKPNRRPYHFQVIINPYDKDYRPYVTLMYKEKPWANYPRIVTKFDKAGPGEDAPILLGKLTGLFPSLTPAIVNQTLKKAYEGIENGWGTHGEVFSATMVRGRVLSAAIGIAAQNTSKVIDIATRLIKENAFVGVFALRYVKGTSATLGFTKFPNTCVAEFDSIETSSTWRYFAALWKALDETGISYTFHWGKVNNLDAPRVRKMYGDKVDDWIEARNRLLSKEMLPVFTNEFMEHTGLHTVLHFNV